MGGLMRKTLLGALAALAAGCWGESAMALDLSPNDYVHLPDGTFVLVNYFNYVEGDTFRDKDGNKIPGSKDRLAFGIERLVYYGETDSGFEWAMQAVMPYGSINARIGGVDADTENGTSDLTLGTAFWAMSSNEPTGTTLGSSTYLILPVGQYDPLKPSMGAGAVGIVEQIGLQQGLGNGFVLDLAGDIHYRFDHTDNGIEVSQKPIYQIQAFLRYNINEAASISFGYSGLFGGKQTYNGFDTGLSTREDQFRLYATTFVSPTIQLQGMVGTDVYAKGGFQQDLVTQLRIVKLF